MHHMFDVDIATKYGILEAILLENLNFWIAKNRANGTNYYDGDYWTYNSTKAFAELFPYASQRKIQNALKKLIEQGILKTGNYNKSAYDRTLWYAFTKKGKSIMQSCKMDDTIEANGLSDNVEPIPDINTDINTNINTDRKSAARPQRTRFTPPTLEEVKAYCEERNNGIDAQHFLDYYSARGWELSKGRKVKDWKACVRTWESNSYNRRPTKQAEKPQQKPKEINVDDFRRADGTIDCNAYMRAQYS